MHLMGSAFHSLGCDSPPIGTAGNVLLALDAAQLGTVSVVTLRLADSAKLLMAAHVALACNMTHKPSVPCMQLHSCAEFDFSWAF